MDGSTRLVRQRSREGVGRVPDVTAEALDVAALVAEHGVRALAFAQRMLGNRADAEDAVQDAFLRAHARAATFRGGAAPSTWLLAIVRNACLDRLRARTPRRFDGLEDAIDQAAASATPPHPTALHRPADDAAERRAYVAAVREGCLLGTLACLTDDQRAAFVLRTLADLDVADVAAILGRSENAVRVLTSRARARLKAFLCRHCSLWDAANPCRCENLVEFSLARGWIGPDDRRLDDLDAESIAVGVAEVARLAALYRSLPTPELRPEVSAQVRAALAALG